MFGPVTSTTHASAVAPDASYTPTTTQSTTSLHAPFNHHFTVLLLPFLPTTFKVRIICEKLRYLIMLMLDNAHAGPLADHLCVDNTTQQLKQSYFWPSRRCDVTQWYASCDQCAKSKGPPTRPHGSLQKVTTGMPLDNGLYTSCPQTDISKYLLVLTDYFTK